MLAIKQRIKGLYAITPDESDTAHLLQQVKPALENGLRLLQYRNKTANTGLRLEQAQALRAQCRHFGATFIVNDDVALAAQVDADGVHLGRDDAGIRAARATLGRDKIIGASCYADLERARHALNASADYLAFGSCFASPTKPQAALVSLARLREVRQVFDVPLVAIGGIDVNNAHLVLNAGIDAVAVISALFNACDIAATTRDFCKLFDVEHA